MEFDAPTLADQIIRIGLGTRDQVREARDDAEDGSLEALKRALLRKQIVTSWQLDRLLKGDTTGFIFGGTKVLFHLAEGTFARVYRGRRIQGNQSVAVKVLRKRFVSDRGAVERFNQEAEAGMKLVHPNIVQTYDYGEQDGNYYMILEYVEGANLRDFLKVRSAINADEGLPLVVGLARGLQYSLSQGVTHRDIKGTNILISNQGEAKLVDFGLATIEGEDKKMAAAHGQRTVDYSALERTCGSPKGDPRSDIFFLGCVFYQMLTGQLPLPEVESKDQLAKMLKRSFGAIKPIGELRNAPPEGLCRIIDKMMKMDLKARYQTMEEVVADLEAYQAARGLPATPTRTTSTSARPSAAPSKPAPRPEPEPSSGELDFGNLDAIFARGPAPAATVEPAAPPAPEPAPASKPAGPRSILCVEAQEPIQDAFRKGLSKMGYRVALVGDAGLAAAQCRADRPDALIFDFDGLDSGALDAFLGMHAEARQGGRDFAALVLLGPRQGGFKEKLPADDHLVVLSKPIKLKDVQDAIGRLVPAG